MQARIHVLFRRSFIGMKRKIKVLLKRGKAELILLFATTPMHTKRAQISGTWMSPEDLLNVG
jgi:hypothetical protein